MISEEKHKIKLCLKSDYKKWLITEFCQGFLGLKLTWNKRRNSKNISYRPNHVDGRRWNGGTDRVSPERCPLSAGGPRLILSSLHVIILNKVRNNEQEKY
jgi:hypothetical protein